MNNKSKDKSGSASAQTKSGVARSAKSKTTNGKTTNGKSSRPKASMVSASADPIKLLKEDHEKVQGLFEQYESASGKSTKAKLIRKICTELVIHATLEEQLFYPACREAASDTDMLDEAQVEHDSAKVLIADLMLHSTDAQYCDAKVAVLAEQVKHHIKEEEKPKTGIFAKAKAAGVTTPELAMELQELKQELQSEADALPIPQPRSFGIFEMAQQDNYGRNKTRSISG